MVLICLFIFLLFYHYLHGEIESVIKSYAIYTMCVMFFWERKKACNRCGANVKNLCKYISAFLYGFLLVKDVDEFLEADW